MRLILNILLALMSVTMPCSMLMSCSDNKLHPILKLENKTDKRLWVVVSTEHPNTCLPTNYDEYNMYCFIETVAGGGYAKLWSDVVTVEDVFDKNPNMVVLIYDDLGYSGEKVEFAKRNHCELISYVLTEKELKSLDLTITVTDEDITKYRETHETVPFPEDNTNF